MERDSVSAYVNMRRDTHLPLYARTCTHFGWPPPSIPPVVYILNGWLISQPKYKEEHSNIVFTEI